MKAPFLELAEDEPTVATAIVSILVARMGGIATFRKDEFDGLTEDNIAKKLDVTFDSETDTITVVMP